MELAIGLTLYLSFGAFLFFGTMGAPPIFARMAIVLCAYELVITVAWVTSRRQCAQQHCPPEQAMGITVGIEIPALTALTLLLAAVYGLRVARRWYTAPDANPRHRRPRQSGRGRDRGADRSRP